MLKLLVLLTLSISFVSQGLFLPESDLEAHLKNSRYISSNGHDNIADSEHTHIHKHSEDGEEHEHHHDHIGSAQSSLKLIVISDINLRIQSSSEYRHDFNYKLMLPSDYPLSIFRPPIV